MLFDFSDFRRTFPDDFEYIKKESLYSDPFKQAAVWFQEILDKQIVDGNAMVLATSNSKGEVSSRVLLLKYLDERGFTFFTNYKSRKGKDLEENPTASLTFYWPSLNRQLRVSGNVEKTSLKESKAYFISRPKRSRLLALASNQDEEIESLEEIEHKLKELEAIFKDNEIPLPEFWGGYRLIPHQFEFWQGGPNRINLRFEYTLKKDQWYLKQLSP
jgi:pyridoxamine 5'-phosphate oxidase